MNNLYSTKQAILKTKRLILRKVSVNDVDIIFELRSNTIVTKYIDRPLMKKKVEALKFILDRKNDIAESKIFYWGIERKDSNKLIGTICLWNFSDDKKSAEIGYDLLPNHFKNGFMNEALQEVISFSFQKLKLSSIEAFTSYKNIESIQLLKKNNFNLQPNRVDKGFPNNSIYSLKSN